MLPRKKYPKPHHPVIQALAFCAVIFMAHSLYAARPPLLIERIDEAIKSDRAFTEGQRAAYLDAFRQELAGYSGDILRGERAEGAEVLLRVVTEGSFDNADIDRTVAIASAAYIAVSRGADAAVVEGIALYGFRKDVGSKEIETWANGYRDCVKFGVPGYIAEDLVFNAVENGWDAFTFNSLKWVLVEAAKAGYPMEEFHSYVMVNFLKGGRRPGALGSEAMAIFREAAIKGEKPVVPEYEGSFIPRSREFAAPAPEAAPVPAKPEKPQTPVRPQTVVPPKPEPEKAPAPPSKSGKGLLLRLEGAWRSFLGVPYVWGGQTKRGMDCSGLVQSVFGQVGVSLPRVTREQWRAGVDVQKTSDLAKGDLVFFRTVGSRISHVGIVTDPASGSFVHASSSRGVVKDRLSMKYFSMRYAGARRVLPKGALALLVLP